MATKKPICLYTGKLKELQSGDTIAGIVIPSGSVEVNFGTYPTISKTVNITDARISSTSVILATQSGKAATSKQADENEMDGLMFSCLAANGSFQLNMNCAPYRIAGNFFINYTIF